MSLQIAKDPTCYGCGNSNPSESRNHGTPYWLCKACYERHIRNRSPEYKLKKKRHDENYRNKQGEALLLKKRQYRWNNRERDLSRKKEWYKANKEEDLARKRERYQKTDPYNEARRRFVGRYGQRCVLCSFSIMTALQCDHINNGGREHRMHNNQIKILNQYVEEYEVWKDAVRVLCANCNMRREREASNTDSRHYRYKEKVADKLRQVIGQTACLICGEKDRAVLDFHHKHGGGTAERKELGPAPHWWNYYIKHPEAAKEKLIVLCCNCHCIEDAKIKLPIFKCKI